MLPRDVTLATAPPDPRPSADPPDLPVTGNAHGTSSFKAVPPTAVLRDRIRRRADDLAARLDRSRPLARHEMETHAQQLLDTKLPGRRILLELFNVHPMVISQFGKSRSASFMEWTATDADLWFGSRAASWLHSFCRAC